jgi:hypothetical protein
MLGASPAAAVFLSFPAIPPGLRLYCGGRAAVMVKRVTHYIVGTYLPQYSRCGYFPAAQKFTTRSGFYAVDGKLTLQETVAAGAAKLRDRRSHIWPEPAPKPGERRTYRSEVAATERSGRRRSRPTPNRMTSTNP